VLSDLAAMGGEPRWALINLVAPPSTPVRRLEAVYRGAAALARAAGLAIVGGDTSAGPGLELHVFAVGRVPRGRALRRAGARPGDRLYVTGTLGGSRAGKHLRFTPRLAEGRWLRAGRGARALMDVSDGLATDLRRLAAASGVGAELDAAAIPVSAAARATRDGRSALEHALADGEDFELLFAVPAARAARFERAWRRTFALRCTCIGCVTPRRGELALRQPDGTRQPLALRGFEHFAGGPS
jgi:thiamine-monophosphate kinase